MILCEFKLSRGINRISFRISETGFWDNSYYENIDNLSNFEDISGTDYDDFQKYCYGNGCENSDLINIDEDMRGKIPSSAIWDGEFWRIIGPKKSKVRVSISTRGGDDSEVHIGIFGCMLKEGTTPIPLVQTNSSGIILPKYSTIPQEIKIRKRVEEDYEIDYQDISMLNGNEYWQTEFDGTEIITISNTKQWPE